MSRMKHMPNEKDLSVNKRCVKCNACCTVNLPLFDDEFEKLKSYIEDEENNIITGFRQIQSMGGYYLMCPFSDTETKRCQIYEERPTVCRIYHCNLSEKERLAVKYIKKNGIPKFTKNLIDAFPEDIREHLKKGCQLLDDIENGRITESSGVKVENI